MTNVNDPPVAVNDSYAVDQNAALNVSIGNGVLANDTDVDTGDTKTAVLARNPQFGSLVLRNDGSFDYVPQNGYFGSDQFTYQARDAAGALSGTATVAITVRQVNQPPVANDDPGNRTTQNLPITISVLNNDTDVDGSVDPTTVAYIAGSGPTFGTVVVNGDGTITYTPTNGLTGTVTFDYTVQDNQGLTSNTATVTVQVDVAPPVWQNQTNHFDVNRDTFITGLDALIDINFINNNVYGNSPLPIPRTAQDPPYDFDVNGDGYLTALDALNIINFINSRLGGEGEQAGQIAMAAPLPTGTMGTTQMLSLPGASFEMRSVNIGNAELPTDSVFARGLDDEAARRKTTNAARPAALSTSGADRRSSLAATTTPAVQSSASLVDDDLLDSLLGPQRTGHAADTAADLALRELLCL